MSSTPLRRTGLKTDLTGDKIDIDLAERGSTKPARRAPIEYAAFAALACAIAIASLVAAPGAAGLLGGALGVLMLAIAVADARAFIIPGKLTVAAFLLALPNAA
ncbi:MAG: hypothetical protein ACREDJ_11275, partial [Methylocella sp.]